MRKMVLALAVLGFVATSAMAAPGESWILPIGALQGGGWTTLAGAGYNGTDAFSANTMDGVRRVYWKLEGVTGSKGNAIPSDTLQYTIEFFRPTEGASDWQPIESQISGSAGEVYPNDPNIPWAGMWGTNHQYIGAEAGTPGAWKTTGTGPHTPENADFSAGANGIYMWLHAGSYMYAKWDYGWAINHAWSAVKITQTPEPISMLLFGLGGAALLRRKARA